jgi:hypothetical protein
MMRSLVLVFITLINFDLQASCELTGMSLPLKLSETCLFKNIRTKEINPKLFSFRPKYQLWSDGAKKSRWVYFPPNTKIDTSEGTNWKFPVGTSFWKEFSKDGLRLEVRLLRKVKPEGESSWVYGTYQWNDLENEAQLVKFGATSVRGTEHDIPSNSNCEFCHGSQESNSYSMRVLGFEALTLVSTNEKIKECDPIQNKKNKNDLTLEKLLAKNILSHNHNWQVSKPKIQGSFIQKEALGYLHINCASCHDSKGSMRSLGMNLRHDYKKNQLEDFSSYLTSFRVPTMIFRRNGITKRLLPQDEKLSAIWFRLNSVLASDKMPPVARRKHDPYGVCVLKSWIKSL